MSEIQKQVGNKCEKEYLNVLQEHGYWCHLFTNAISGQPCDIVAIKDNVAYLIDVKHCDKDRFEFYRIEANQRSCFEYAMSKGNKNVGFAVYFEAIKEFVYIPYMDIKDFEKKGLKSIRYDYKM